VALSTVAGIGADRAFAAVGLLPKAESPETVYHHVSALKFSILSICTFDLYVLFWFYKNWKFVRQRDSIAIRPFWRALFSPLWCYSLCRDVSRAGGKIAAAAAGSIAVSYFLFTASWRLPDPWWLISTFSFVPLLFLVREIDAINQDRGAKATYYGSFRFKHIALCVVEGAVLAFATLSSFNVLPSTQVIEGERLPRRDRAFLLENGIVTDLERIHYFYSGGLFSIGDDGNLVTDQRVISYYRDPDADRRVVESARYREILDVRVKYSTSPFKDTEIQIITGDDDDELFILTVSAEDQRDRLFVNKLMELWKAERPAEK